MLPAPSADVVIDVHLVHDEPAALREPAAIVNLPRDPELVAFPVRRDPRIDSSANIN
jgi:hypothetical protein